METLDHLSGVWFRFFFPTTLYQEGEKPSEYCKQTLLLPTAGIEPGPPAQQASVLSITPLPLGKKVLLLESPKSPLNFRPILT